MVAAVQRWLLRGGAVALPLIYCPFTYDSYVLPKLLFARSLVLALGVLLIVRWISAREIVIRGTPLDIPLLAFIGSALVSAVAGVNFNVGLFGIYSRYDGTLTLVTYAALYWLAVQSTDKDEARGLLRALLVGGYLVALSAVGQWIRDTLLGNPIPRGYGTLGNANVLGSYLALLLPVAYHELRTAGSAAGRLVMANVMAIMGLALLMSVSHSAWLGVGVAALILIAGRQLPALERRWQLALGAGAIAVFILAAPIALSRSTDVAQRIHIWKDSLSLIASSPYVGYGPDTFGLVYPGFQTGQWVLGYPQIDKAHSELLQVAATQGLIGAVLLLWILATFLRAFWRGRGAPAAWPLFAGWAAYQTVLMLNFTALSSALPFWIFAAAAMTEWNATREARVVPRRARLPLAVVGVAAALGLVALALPAVVMPYLADQALAQAVALQVSGHIAEGAPLAAQARDLAPQESVYAVEAGNIAFENGDWAAARAAYGDATRLGTFNPRLYRDLAVTDRNLGLNGEALAAARQAVYLDRFDPANQALLAQMELGS